MQQPHESATVNIDSPIKIAEKIWWVGHALLDDPFQCHAYLIESGDQSVLIDPGSVLTFKHTLSKIEDIIPFDQIRYFLCQHQDPDITGALSIIDKMVTREDAVILSHWRANTLLKHYGLQLPFMCVEQNEWVLDLGERKLEFIFTPYLHFPGAFCTYDRETRTMFSSDLFGGFTEKWALFADDESYFDAMRPFHEHYMPSRDILVHALNKIEQYPMELIAPQHGSIIPERLIPFIVSQLKNLDCGLFLMSQTSTDIIRLTKLNKLLRGFMEKMVFHRDFDDITKICFEQIKEVMPALGLEFYFDEADRSSPQIDLSRGKAKGYHLLVQTNLKDAFGMSKTQWLEKYGEILYENSPVSPESRGRHFVAIPLFGLEMKTLFTIAVLYLPESYKLDDETKGALLQLSLPLSVALERDILYRKMEIEKEKFYNQSIRDPLTNLYTRTYMKEAVERLFSIHDRNPDASIGVLALDIDHFKSVNDAYGHNAGDQVLKIVAQILFDQTRKGDIQVRLGGEEFAVFISCNDISIASETAERIRVQVAQLELDGPMKDHKFGISGGVVMHTQKESVSETLERADTALYKAKNNGRNQVCICSLR